ncbi:MAG: nucleotidyltransferase domain-containing protein [Ferruginibacter sp.]
MDLKETIRQNPILFKELCQQHRVQKLYAFGSSITNRFNESSSDIDLLVDVDIPDPANRGETLLSLWDKLEVFFKRRVDLLTTNSIRNPFLKSNIERSKELIYDGEAEKVLV